MQTFISLNRNNTSYIESVNTSFNKQSEIALSLNHNNLHFHSVAETQIYSITIQANVQNVIFPILIQCNLNLINKESSSLHCI